MQEPAIVSARAYDLSLWLFQKAEHLPRAHRILLGDRLIDSGLDLLLFLVRAAYLPARSPHKAELLDRAALESALRGVRRCIIFSGNKGDCPIPTFVQTVTTN